MPDKAAYPLASMLVPFGIARDKLAQVDERIGALGAGVGEVVAALAQRMNTLPAAAVFEPFANAQQGGLAGALQGVMRTGKPKSNALARQARRAAALAAARGTHTPLAGPLSIARMLGKGASSVAQAATLEKIMRSIGSSRSRQDAHGRKVGPVQAAARAAQLAAQEQAALDKFWLPVSGQLAADLVSQLLKTVAPTAQALGRLPGGAGLAAMVAPQGLLGQPGLGQALRDAMAGATDGAAAPRSPRSRAPRRTPQAAASAAGGLVGSAQLGGIVEALIDAITQGKPAARNTARSRPRKAAEQHAPAAPRAPTRLLPPAASPAPQAAARDTTHAAPPPGTDDGSAALDELHRALLDQAWLRGVDLR